MSEIRENQSKMRFVSENRLHLGGKMSVYPTKNYTQPQSFNWYGFYIPASEKIRRDLKDQPRD